MTKAVIFDFFGVICPDLHKVWTSRHRINDPGALYREIGERIDLGLAPESAYIDTLSAESGIPNADIRKELHDMTVIDEEVVGIIKALKARYKIGLLSDASATLLRRILEENDLSKYFDAIGISAEIGFKKPRPEGFRFVLGALGAAPEEAVFIDDLAANVRAAEALGMKGILFENAEELRAALGPIEADR